MLPCVGLNSSNNICTPFGPCLGLVWILLAILVNLKIFSPPQPCACTICCLFEPPASCLQDLVHTSLNHCLRLYVDVYMLLFLILGLSYFIFFSSTHRHAPEAYYLSCSTSDEGPQAPFSKPKVPQRQEEDADHCPHYWSSKQTSVSCCQTWATQWEGSILSYGILSQHFWLDRPWLWGQELWPTDQDYVPSKAEAEHKEHVDVDTQDHDWWTLCRQSSMAYCSWPASLAFVHKLESTYSNSNYAAPQLCVPYTGKTPSCNPSFSLPLQALQLHPEIHQHSMSLLWS